jgi:hypothetical protein
MLRQRLHERFDRWLDTLEGRLSAPHPTLSEVTQAVWDLRQSLTGSGAEAIIVPTYQDTAPQPSTTCPQGERCVKRRGPVRRHVATLVGAVPRTRAYFYWVPCGHGFYPLDKTLALAPGRKQCAVQQAAAQLVAAVPYDTAHVLCTELTGVPLGTERMHTRTTQMANGLTVLDVAPSRREIGPAVETLAARQQQPPVMGLAIDGAPGPTRPETARGRCTERQGQRAKRPRWQGQYREAKGLRCSLRDDERRPWAQLASGANGSGAR